MKCPKCKADNSDTKPFCADCGTRLTPSEVAQPSITKTLETPILELTTGSTFADRYQIIEELGRGGMGRVYKAIDTRLKEKIALKLIKPEIASDKNTLARFENELKLARTIAHKNVGRMFDINEEEGSLYITMEYVPGQDLKGLIRQSGYLAIDTVLSIAKQICEGLSEAHRLGVIHRDLKPSNIMIDKEGNARIMDFGIARSLKTKGITGSRIMVGTPEYMSPEQADAKDIDERSDVYSLGVLLYEMVSGKIPFEGDTPLSVVLKHKQEAPLDPIELKPQMPRSLSQLILKCLEKNKEGRYRNVEEILTELGNIEEGLPVSKRVIPKRKPKTHKEITFSFSLRKIFIPMALLIGIVITGIVALQLLPKKQPVTVLSSMPCLGVLYFENHSGDEKLNHFRIAFPELLITSLSNSEHLRVLRLDEINSILQALNLMDVNSYSLENLYDLAKRGGINHIVRGSYIKTGNNLTVITTLIDADTGKTTLSLSVQAGEETNLPSNINYLAEEIKMLLDKPPVEASMEQAIEDFGTTLTVGKK